MRRTPLLVAFVAAVSLTAAACTSSDNGIALDTVRTATVVEVVDVPASVTARAVATLTAPADADPADLAARACQYAALEHGGYESDYISTRPLCMSDFDHEPGSAEDDA